MSYLASRPSRDLVIAAHQQITADWWHGRRQQFDLFISQVVLNEARAGDPEAATRRLAHLRGSAAGSGYDLPTICTPEELLGEAHA